MEFNNFEKKSVSNTDETLHSLVSVIIPTYNREKTLERAVNSVLSQTFKNFEVIIVDDNSTDNTMSLISRYENNDFRIRYLQHHKNLGAQAARNTGIKEAKGKWIAFLDSDDEWLPEKLEKNLECAYSQNVPVVHSECYKKYEDDNSLKLFGVPKLFGNVYPKLLSSPGPVFPALLVRKECFEHINYLDEKIVSYQEWDTSIRLAELYPFAFIEEPLFIYHYHAGDTISKDMRRDVDGWRQIVEKHRNEILSHAGRNALGQHYLIISKKYKSVGEVKLGSKFEYMALQNLSAYDRCKYRFTSMIYKIPFFKCILQVCFSAIKFIFYPEKRL